MKKIFLTSFAALFAVGAAEAAKTPFTYGTGGNYPEVPTSVGSAQILASQAYVDRTDIELGAAINFVRAEKADHLGNGAFDVIAIVDSDGQYQRSTKTLADFAGALTAGDAIDPTNLASDIGSVMYDGTTVNLNSDGELQVVSGVFQGALTASDGIDITSDVITAVGDISRAVTVTSAGIGVKVNSDTKNIIVMNSDGLYVDGSKLEVHESDGIKISSDNEIRAFGASDKGIVVASDGIAVKVDGTSVKFNTSGELEVDASAVVKADDTWIEFNGSDELTLKITGSCTAGAGQHCILTVDPAGGFEWVTVIE